MFELMLVMFERLGLIVMLAFIATRLRFFRDMVSSAKLSGKQEYTAILFFGIFGIVGTYSGVTFQTESFVFDRPTTGLLDGEAIANFRVIGIVLAGLFGGYKVGAAAGLIAGVHRMFLGGFTAFSCGIATIITGVFAAWYRSKNPHVTTSPLLVFCIGALAEMLQMGLILLLARPFNESLALVQNIGFPMILANGIGCALFLLIIKSVTKEEEKAASLLAQKSLRIAKQTLVHLKSGLTVDSADAVCTILHKELNITGSAITKHSNLLAHIGAGNNNSDTFPVVTAPLVSRNEIIGTLKFYFHSDKEITAHEKEMLSGLANLLSSQLELAEADKFYELAKDAEITALQAQINPHFLFNTLNTIISLVRLDPEKARMTLRSLSKFIRKNVESTTVSLHTLEDELEHIKSYLAIEKIRFEDRINVFYNIDENCLHDKIPPLTLQPIIENAIKHGFRQMSDECRLYITVKEGDDMVSLCIEDNGSGVGDHMLEKLAVSVDKNSEGTGIGLYNINKRLNMTFGEKYGLQFKSAPDNGLSVHFKIPKATL